MRIAIIILSALSLMSLGVGMFEAVNAIGDPVSCPGAFLGCSQNGEENSYYFSFLGDILAAVTGLLFVIWGQNKLLPGWRRWVNIGFIVTLILIPLPIPIGFVAAIFLSTVLPGYGVFLYLIFPLAASVIFLLSATRGIARPATVAGA